MQHFTTDNQIMQASHNFRNAGLPVPPMDIEKIDVRGAQVLERLLDRQVLRFGAVAGILDLLFNRWVVLFEGRAVLREM